MRLWRGRRPPQVDRLLGRLLHSRLAPAAKELQRATWSDFRRIQDRDDRYIARILSYLLREDSSCIDVGAHVGDVLRICERLAPRGHHHAFEPIPALAARLRTSFPDVEVHEVALTDDPGPADFHYVATNPGYSGLRRRQYPRHDEHVETLSVVTARLDDVVPPERRIDFIKIDVEGAELQVMRGGRHTISRWQPFIIFEHGRGAADYYGTTPEMVHDFLARECGLAIFTLDGAGPYGAGAFREIYEAGRWWNFLARPYAAR